MKQEESELYYNIFLVYLILFLLTDIFLVIRERILGLDSLSIFFGIIFIMLFGYGLVRFFQKHSDAIFLMKTLMIVFAVIHLLDGILSYLILDIYSMFFALGRVALGSIAIIYLFKSKYISSIFKTTKIKWHSILFTFILILIALISLIAISFGIFMLKSGIMSECILIENETSECLLGNTMYPISVTDFNEAQSAIINVNGSEIRLGIGSIAEFRQSHIFVELVNINHNDGVNWAHILISKSNEVFASNELG